MQKKKKNILLWHNKSKRNLQNGQSGSNKSLQSYQTIQKDKHHQKSLN